MNESDNSLYKSLWHAYFDHAHDGIFVLTDEASFLDTNQQLRAWAGLDSAGETQSPSLTDLVGTGRTLRLFREQIALARNGQSVRFECHIQPRNGTPRWIEVSLHSTTLDTRTLIIGMARDVTERRQLVAALEHQANFDDLTGLKNRRCFAHHLERLLHSARNDGRSHALIYIDIDHFKVINDTCGHGVGDQFLAELSGALRKKVRRSDVLARIGGDEFGVLLEDCTVERAMCVAENLRMTVAEQRFTWNNRIFHNTASIGVTAITRERTDASLVLSYADAACYVAKDSGRNSVQLFFGGESCARKRAEMNWVAHINTALEQDSFRLYYQKIMPVVDSGACHEHCEVLVRMIDADGNMVPPMDFIPAAEKYDLMSSVDRWVLRTLLAARSQEWSRIWSECERQHKPCSLLYAVNISGASVCDTGFLDFLLAEIDAHAVPPGVLCLEITETMAIRNMDKARQFIERVRAAGCRIALDDFGSGMSSFVYLKELPIDYLKIDGSLIRHIAEDEADLGIVDAVNRIGHLLGFKTVAEYVEDAATMTALRRIGIDYAQGFGVHIPEPLDSVLPATLRASGG